MPVADLIPALRLLDERSSWRLSELPAEITHAVLIELDRFKLIETQLWTRTDMGRELPEPQPDRDGWRIVYNNQKLAGPMDWLIDPRAYLEGCEPEFRVSPEAARYLIPTGPGVASPLEQREAAVMGVRGDLARILEAIGRIDRALPPAEKQRQLEIQQTAFVRLYLQATGAGVLPAWITPPASDAAPLPVWEAIARAMEPLFPGLPRVDDIADANIPLIGTGRALNLSSPERIDAWIEHARILVQSTMDAVAHTELLTPPIDPVSPEGEWSAPMTRSEMTRRITGDHNARPRKMEALLSRWGLEHVSGKLFRVRLDTMDANTRRKMESPL